MAVINADQVYIKIEKQEMEDAACKYCVTFWYKPHGIDSMELINICLTNNKPMVQSLKDKGNIVETVTDWHEIDN